jgi:hypothetical protein
MKGGLIKTKSKVENKKTSSKHPSKELLKLISNYGASIKTLKGLLVQLKEGRDKIFDKGRKEGLSDIEIGNLIRQRLRPLYSDRQIQRYLPDSAKHLDKASKVPKPKQEPEVEITRQMSAKSELQPELKTEPAVVEEQPKPDSKMVMVRTPRAEETIIPGTTKAFDLSEHPDVKPYIPTQQESIDCICDVCNKPSWITITEGPDGLQYALCTHYNEAPIGIETDPQTGKKEFKYRTCLGPRMYSSIMEGLANAPKPDQIKKNFDYKKQNDIIYNKVGKVRESVDCETNYRISIPHYTIEGSDEFKDKALRRLYLQTIVLKRNLEEEKVYRDQYFDEIKRLKAKYKICELCEKPGKPQRKGYDWVYCDRHLKQQIKLNETLGPIANEVFQKFVGVNNNKK